MEQHHHEDHHHHHHEEDGLTLHTSAHEGAVITAYRFDLEGDPQAAQAAAEEALAVMGREVDKAGGIIGHI
jgi:G3E family GTPase